MPSVFGDYSSIYSVIRLRLQDGVSDWADSEFDPEIEATLRKLLTPYLVDFSNLSTDDKPLVDYVCGLEVAAKLLTPSSTGGANSDLVLEKTNTTTRQFAQISGQGKGEKDKWIQDARENWALVSFVAARRDAIGYRAFDVNGPRRQAQ